MSAFIALIVLAFAGVGQLWRAEERNKPDLIMSWALGISLFQHCMIFIGVNYFGQINMVWYFTLAAIQSLAGKPTRGSKTRKRTKHWNFGDRSQETD